MMKHLLSALFFLPLYGETFQVTSPDQSIQVELELGERAAYSVSRAGEPIITPSQLGFVVKDAPPLDGPFKVLDSARREIDETWKPVWGQFAEIRNHANELRMALQETESPGRRMNVVFRVFDDGVGFRYEFPKQDGLESFEITDELTAFSFAADHRAWWVEALPDTYERDYNESSITACGERGASTPVTLRTSKGTHVSLHEADLTDWAGMKLKRKPGADPLSLEADLVPWFNSEVKVKCEAPHVSPWRTITIGDTAGDLVESTLVLNLNDPCEIQDTSWIEPTKFMGIWWGCITGVWNWERQANPDKHGATTERAMRYIDACARNNIPALLIEGWCEGWEGDIAGWGDMDFTRPYPDFDIRKITDYGREKGVSLIGHHETGGNLRNYEDQLPQAFEYYEKYGIHRIKTGYVTGDIPLYTEGLTDAGREHHHGQFNVRHHQKVIEMAAEHRMMIDAHEPIKGTGIERTWPNFVAREGARGGEFNHFIGNPPSQTVTLPFTRLLGGPMDYTPGLFDTAYDKDKRFGTRCQQLSLMVTLFSPVVMAADFYQAYDGEPATQFIRNLPVGKWDDTRVLAAEVGDYLATVRRHGESWFLGVTNNEEERQLDLDLGFLKEGVSYQLVLYADGDGADYRENPYPVAIESRTVRKNETLHLKLASGGGAVAEFYPDGVKFTPPPSETWSWKADGVYKLRAKHSGRLVTARNGQVIQHGDGGSLRQDWIFKDAGDRQVAILSDGKALTAMGSENGSKVELIRWAEDDPRQKWTPRHIVGSWFHLENVANGRCLDVEGLSYSDGAGLHTWEFAWGANQVWSLEEP